MPQVVWFNKNFSSVYNIIELIKAEDAGKEFTILCTHENPEFVGFEVSDLHAVETRCSEEHYIDYCLDMCKKYQVSLFYPSKGMIAVERQRELFASLNVQLITCADADTIEILNDKGRFYATLSPDDFPIPLHAVVNTVDQFESAYEQIKDAGKIVCIKPARSIYGLGFRIIKDDVREIDFLFSGNTTDLTRRAARETLAGVARFQDLLVMEYLEGPEYSIDCLAQDGRLIRATVRKKPGRAGGAQLLEENSALYDLARSLTKRLQLRSLFNIQARCSGGVPKLLEINARMAGGIYFSCLSGVNYPYWALRLAKDDCEHEIPRQVYGIRVNQVYRPFVATGHQNEQGMRTR